MKVYGISVFDNEKLIHTEVYREEKERNKKLRDIYFDNELNEHFIDLFECDLK